MCTLIAMDELMNEICFDQISLEEYDRIVKYEAVGFSRKKAIGQLPEKIVVPLNAVHMIPTIVHKRGARLENIV